MSVAPSLDRVDVETARRIAGNGQIVVVSPDDVEVGRYRILRYSGVLRGKGIETFAVKDANDKFFVKSEKELGLSEKSANMAFLATDFDANDLIDLTEQPATR